MNRLFVRLKAQYADLPLKRKLLFSYSVPIIAICIAITLAFYPLFLHYYTRQSRRIQDQSCMQAVNFISEYVGNMHYISRIIENSATVTGIISETGLSARADVDKQYREFWKLYQEMLKISVINSIYRIGMYIPDELVYSNNDYYFYPESTLRQRPDFPDIERRLDAGSKVFVPLDEISSYSPSVSRERHIALLGKISSPEKADSRWSFITKVEIPVSEFVSIMQAANTTNAGLVYLNDSDGNYIASSDTVEYGSLADTGMLPVQRAKKWSPIKIPGHGTFYVLWYGMEKYNWQLFCLIPVSEFRKQGYPILFVMLVIIVLLSAAVIAVSYALASSYTKRLTALSRNMTDLGSGKFSAAPSCRIPAEPYSGDEIDAIYRNFFDMAEELQRLMDDHYRQGKSVVTAELKALQSQINPHFLYNTLDLINWEAMKYKAGNIAQIAQNLGQFYRLSLNHGKAAIRISGELKHVESYVNIENAHFDGAIHLEIIVAQEIQEYACLGIILQPFVENAIVHGIADHPEIRECSVCISAEFGGEDIVFDIRDNGPGMSAELQREIIDGHFCSTGSGYGIQNINSRLKLCYGDGYGVSFDSAPGKGTIVHIRIPALTLSQLEEKLR